MQGSKQIVYTRFVNRIFSNLIDLLILLIITSPISNFIQSYLFKVNFSSCDNPKPLNLRDQKEVVDFVLRCMDIMPQEQRNKVMMSFAFSTIAWQILFIGIYFVIFWHKVGTTPGKYLMRMRISDTELNKITISAAIKRYIMCVLFPFGLFAIPFNKQGMALHDRFAKTVVIKM